MISYLIRYTEKSLSFYTDKCFPQNYKFSEISGDLRRQKLLMLWFFHGQENEIIRMVPVGTYHAEKENGMANFL